ncbi:hypothetical protein BCR33DRAFT_734738 [Rhizoclosmatium globosum]|uniref:Uncharacterized protein n=1 Tax=Rhizoclosmatium globosum TaxID=329046 RepID=A0A1Y2CSJ6_9FUNG|nr:hypothetical protein BCR33DRAFT_734738 [Rhizoclosmatium globosum]|eukprot:ORY50008.1 hypothetical protein BCR33DRAFT_734738 [Rhizoclosmatium globosum]
MNTHINSSSASMASYTTNSYPFARRHFSTTETVTDPTKAMPPPPRYNSASSARTGSLAAASAAEAFDMMRTAPQHNMHTLPRDPNVQNNNSTSSNNQQQNLLFTLNQMKYPDTHQRKSSNTMDFQLNHHHQRSSSTLPNTVEQPHLQNNPQYHRPQQTQSLPLLNFPVTDDTDAVSDATITALSTPYQEDRSDILGGGMMARSGLEATSSDHSSSCLGCLECLRGMQNTLYQGNMLYSGQAVGVSYYQGSQPHGVGWET